MLTLKKGISDIHQSYMVTLKNNANNLMTASLLVCVVIRLLALFFKVTI